MTEDERFIAYLNGGSPEELGLNYFETKDIFSNNYLSLERAKVLAEIIPYIHSNMTLVIKLEGGREIEGKILECTLQNTLPIDRIIPNVIKLETSEGIEELVYCQIKSFQVIN